MAWFSRHKKLTVVLSAVLVVVLAVGGYAAYLYHTSQQALTNIERHDDFLPSTKPTVASPSPSSTSTPKPTKSSSEKPQSSPEPTKTSQHEPMMFLLMGSDIREGEKTGRSDTLMTAYVPADRKSIYLISMPRDAFVDIPGHPTQKINAAYSLGGPQLTAETVQNVLGTPIDHVAIIDFNGFMDMIDSLGGVTINNPYEGCDDNQNVCWKSGEQTLNKEQALQYVRWRHGLPNGDITRSENQQRVVKAIIEKTIQSGAIANPDKTTDLINTVSDSLSVDSALTNDVIMSLASSLNIDSSDDIKTVTLPIAGFGSDPTYGSIDIVDEARLGELQHALATDTMEDYYQKHKNDPVAGKDTTAEVKPQEAPKKLVQPSPKATTSHKPADNDSTTINDESDTGETVNKDPAQEFNDYMEQQYG